MKISKNKIFADVLTFVLFLVLVPFVASAASGTCSSVSGTLNIGNSNIGIREVINWFTCLIEGSIIPLMFSIATISFVYGIIKFVLTNDSEEKAKGRMFMVWGVVAMAVMFSVWGLVGILENTFGINSNFIPQLPIK